MYNEKRLRVSNSKSLFFGFKNQANRRDQVTPQALNFNSTEKILQHFSYEEVK